MIFKNTTKKSRTGFLCLIFLIFVPIRINAEAGHRALNILLVVSYFPKLSETFILNQVIGLLDLGHNVQIYAVKKEDDLVHDAFYAYKLSERVIYHNDSIIEKKRFFSKTCFDIVLCHFGHRGYLGHELIQTYAINAPLFTIFHGVDMSTNVDANPHLYDKLFSYLDLALPISSYWKNKLIGLGYSPEKIRVQYLGVDCDVFQFQPRLRSPGQPTRFITIARFIEKKGIEYGLRAFAQVAQENERVEYILIGDGPLQASIKELIDRLGIADKVQLLGSRTQLEVIELIKNAHILLAPCVTATDGDKEGIPVSMMEAMATGLPVISTYHSGIPELVQDGVTGFLVDEKNVTKLSEKMKYMTGHPEIWPIMGKAGRDRVVDMFNHKKQNERLIEVFNEFISKKPC